MLNVYLHARIMCKLRSFGWWCEHRVSLCIGTGRRVAHAVCARRLLAAVVLNIGHAVEWSWIDHAIDLAGKPHGHA